MAAILFDTLRLSRNLQEKGRFAAEQADALAEALGETAHEDLATKADLAMVNADLAAVKAELKTDIAELRAELKADISELRAELKTDIAELRAELKTDISGLRAELKADIAGVKADILKWVVGAIGFQTAATLGTVVGLVKIFAR